MSTVRFGVIGLGIQGQQLVRCAQTLPDVEVMAVCSRRLERAQQVADDFDVAAAFDDVEAMLDGAPLDAVAVATPDHLHVQPTLSALAHGCDVLLEKPMALSVAEAQQIVAASDQSGKLVMVNFSHRHQTPTLAIKQRVDAGEFGDPVYAYACLNNTLFVPLQMLSWSAATALPHWLMSHELDRIRWFFNSEAVRVTAVKHDGVLRAKGVDAADVYQATVVFENGAIANLESTWILPETAPFVADCKCHFVFSDGYVDIDHNEPVLKVATSDSYSQPGIMGGQVRGQPVGTVFEAVRQFIACVRGESQPDVTARDGLAITRICCAIIQAAESGAPVAP